MKNRISHILAWLFSFDITYNFFSKYKSENSYIDFLILYSIRFKDQRLIKSYFKNTKIIKGVFVDLLIPKYKVVTSAYYPKLLGTYEIEIQDHILNFISDLRNTYFIDFGCADGYYLAVAKKVRQDLLVIGVDIDEKALKLSYNILKQNKLNDTKIILSKEFDEESIRNYSQGIMVVDCEGFEAKLIENLSNTFIQKTNFIIEIHDFVDATIFENVSNKLSLTHTMNVDYSTELENKLISIPIELNCLSNQSKFDLITESRPQKMRWIIAQIKI